MAKSQLTEKLKLIVKWLKDSRLKVNESKTELCKFHKTDSTQVEIILKNDTIKSQKSMNVLGVEFDSKMNWTPHINKSILKANKALHAIKMKKNIFQVKNFETF